MSLGQATVVPIASEMNSTSEFGLHTLASSIFETSTQTLEALGPKTLKCTKSVGSVEHTRPSATVLPEFLQSKRMHFFFEPLVVPELVLIVYNIIKMQYTLASEMYDNNITTEIQIATSKLTPGDLLSTDSSPAF